MPHQLANGPECEWYNHIECLLFNWIKQCTFCLPLRIITRFDFEMWQEEKNARDLWTVLLHLNRIIGYFFFESNAMWYVLALVHMAIVHHVHGFSPFFPIFNLKNGFTDHLILVLIEMIFQYSRLYFGALERMLGILIFLRRTKNPGVGNTLGNWMHSMPCREKLLIGNATEDIQVHYSQCHWREKLRTAQIWKIPDFGRIRSMFSYKLLVKRAETSEIMHSKSYF